MMTFRRPSPPPYDAARLEPALRRYFRRRAAAHEVEDLVQEVFIRLQSRRSEEAVEDMDRYVFVVAANVLMRRYRNGGTPWFILIDPDGRVVYNHFRIDADKLVTFLKRLENEPAAPEPGPDMLTWKGVIQLVETGNPTPPRRVERSEAEWAQQLTPEQFRITQRRESEALKIEDVPPPVELPAPDDDRSLVREYGEVRRFADLLDRRARFG
ncbi:MAG: hypothetical protein J0I28_04290, partial [Caulobacterales bacterium]|nr:hypothetical protein [Caulobacterales bacterium]